MATAVPIWDKPALRRSLQKMGGDPPTWMQVFPYPKYVCTIDGEKTTLITDDASQASIVAVWKDKGNDLFVDYEHATTTEGVFYAPAAGRIVEVVAGGKLGLLIRVEWTDEAAADIRAGRYYYDSPTFLWSPEDMRVYILVGLALTNYPGSYDRPYITEHNAANYDEALNKTAAKATTHVPIAARLQLKCAKGGAPPMAKKLREAFQKLLQSVQKLTADALRSVRYAFDLPMTITGNELATFLEAVLANIERSDEPVFIVEESEKEAAKGAQTLGEFLARLAQQKGDDNATDLTSLRVALDVQDEKADVGALTLAVLTMKANTVPVAKYRELEQQLAEAKTTSDSERVELLITSNKERLTPDTEKEVRRLAAQSFDLAQTFVKALPPLDLASQSSGTAPKPAPTTTQTPATVFDESKAAHERTLAIAEEKGISYSAANDLRKKEVAAAAK